MFFKQKKITDHFSNHRENAIDICVIGNQEEKKNKNSASHKEMLKLRMFWPTLQYVDKKDTKQIAS